MPRTHKYERVDSDTTALRGGRRGRRRVNRIAPLAARLLTEVAATNPRGAANPRGLSFGVTHLSTIHVVDGLCGCGKTYAAVRYAVSRAAAGAKFLVVQPTRALIDETLRDAAAIDRKVRTRAIHADTDGKVIAEIVNHTKTTAPGGELLFITHSAFMLLPYFDRPQQWHVIFDEIPQADFCEELTIPESHHLITDLIEVDHGLQHFADNRYVRVRPTQLGRLQAIARNVGGDQVWSIFQPFASRLISPHWACYVLYDQYANLLAGNGERRRLLAFAQLQPSLFEDFASATVMGACFQQSVLSYLWREMGVQFRPHAAIERRLRYRRHANGHLLTIRYATDEPWSKVLRDRPTEDDPMVTVFDRVVMTIQQTLTGQDFVWMGNTDVKDDTFGARGQRLPNSPYGLNPYQHLHHAVIISALNPRPAHFAFLEAAGLDSDAVRQAGYWQTVYQAAMRISLRNPADQHTKSITVMDRTTAGWLAEMFPGAVVRSLGVAGLPTRGTAGRRRKHASDADRTRAYREKFKAEPCAALTLVNGQADPNGPSGLLAAELRQRISEYGFGRDQDLSTMGRCDLNALGGTVFASIFDAKPFDFMPRPDIESFVAGLREFHARAIPSKEQNALISPAIFDPDLAVETSRGTDNIRALWGIWLDNDGGDLSHQEFARLFPQLRMAIFNSYRSTASSPRWRVFIPTTIAMPVAAYEAIVGQIMRTVNRAGYWSAAQIGANPRIKSRRQHGFDISKLAPASLFYLPAQAANPADSFSVDHAGGDRGPLDPYVWAGYAAKHLQAAPEPAAEPAPLPAALPAPQTISPAMRRLSDSLRANDETGREAYRRSRREAAIAKWRAESGWRGIGNRKFFELAVSLARTGMSHAEVVSTLRDEATYARRPQDRRRQIWWIMKAIRNRPNPVTPG